MKKWTKPQRIPEWVLQDHIEISPWQEYNGSNVLRFDPSAANQHLSIKQETTENKNNIYSKLTELRHVKYTKKKVQKKKSERTHIDQKRIFFQNLQSKTFNKEKNDSWNVTQRKKKEPFRKIMLESLENILPSSKSSRREANRI